MYSKRNVNGYLYILNNRNYLLYSLLFSAQGNLLYIIDDPSYIQNIITNKSVKVIIDDVEYIIINSFLKTEFTEHKYINGVNIINSYFAKIFRTTSRIYNSEYSFDLSAIIKKNLNKGNTLDIGSNKVHNLLFQSGINSNYTMSLDAHKSNSKSHVVGDATFLPFKEKSFDLILCNFVLEHIHSVSNTIKASAVVLTNTGSLIITIPALDFCETMDYIVNKRSINLPIFHFRAFSILKRSGSYSLFNLYRLLSKAGLEIISIHTFSKGRENTRLFSKSLNKYSPFKYFGEQLIIVCKKYENNIN